MKLLPRSTEIVLVFFLFCLLNVPAYSAPAAGDDTASTQVNAPVTINVLQNDVPDLGSSLVNGTINLQRPYRKGISPLRSGQVRFTPKADFAGDEIFKYTVQDSLGLISNVATVTVTINGEPTDITLTPETVSENVAVGTSVGAFSTTDPNVSDTHSYTLVSGAGSGDNALFQISGSNLQTNSALDFETKSSYSIRVRSTDSGAGNLFFEKAFTITVTNANDAPLFTKGQDQTVNEDAGAQTVNGWATNISDGDGGGQVLSFNITGNSNSSLFSAGPTISSDGNLTYTPAANANGFADITVTISDNGSNTSPSVNTSAPQTFRITVNPVNDIPGLSAANPPAVNEDAGPITVNGWVTAFNAGPSNESTQTVLNYTVSNVSNPGQFTSLPSVSNTGVLTYQLANNANGTFSFDVSVRDNGGTTNGGIDTSSVQTFTITANPVNDPPQVTAPGPFAVTGNVSISVSAPGLLTTVTDTADGAGASPFTVSSSSITTAQGGTVTVNTSTGSFNYNPPAGYEGADSFSYQVCDSGVPGSACTSATVTLNISGMIWFIDNNAAAGNGRLSSPFNSLAAFQAVNNGTGNNPAAGDNIFIYESASAYVGPVTLLNNQKLIGQDATASLASITGLTLAPNSVPLPGVNSGNGTIVQVTNQTASGTAIGLSNAASATIRGLTVGNVTASGNGIASVGVAGFGVLTVSDTSINTDGRALNLSTGTLNGTFNSITSTGGVNNINLSTVVGTSTINAGSLSGASGAAFNITGGIASVTYSGNISQSNNAAAVSVSGGHATGTLTFQTGTINASNGTGLQFDNADGTYNFNGTTTLNGGDAGVDIVNGSSGTFTFGANASIVSPTGIAYNEATSTANVTFSGSITKGVSSPANAIKINGKTSGTTTFNGGISASTTTANAIDLTGNTGGTVNICDDNPCNPGATGAIVNTLTTTTGTALNVANTNIGANKLEFRSIISNGGANGIVLNNTGTGGLTVTGTGANDTGGTILNKSGDAISLTQTGPVSLSWMRVENNLGNGIFGSSVNGLSLGNVRVINNADNDAIDEAGVRLLNLLGTSTWSSVEVADSLEDNAQVINSGSNNLTQLTISNSVFRDNSAVSPGNNGLIIQADGSANMTVDIVSTDFLRNRANGVQVINNGTGTVDVEVGGAGSDFTNNNIGVNIAHNGPSPGKLLFDVTPGTFNSTLASPVNLNLGGVSTAGSVMEGNAINNDLDNNQSTTGPGFRVTGNGGGTMTLLMQGNDIIEVANRGIEIIARDGSNTINPTIHANTINLTSAFAADAVHISAGAASTDTTKICADINGDNVTGNRNIVSSVGGDGIEIRERFAGTSFTLEDYTGSPTDLTAVQNFLSARNDGGDNFVASGSDATVTFGTTANCPSPTP